MWWSRFQLSLKKGTALDRKEYLFDWIVYGAYGISMTPYFNYLENSLAIKGVVIAIPHVAVAVKRGGMVQRRNIRPQNPIPGKIFNSCAEYLIQAGYTSAGKWPAPHKRRRHFDQQGHYRKGPICTQPLYAMLDGPTPCALNFHQTGRPMSLNSAAWKTALNAWHCMKWMAFPMCQRHEIPCRYLYRRLERPAGDRMGARQVCRCLAKCHYIRQAGIDEGELW